MCRRAGSFGLLLLLLLAQLLLVDQAQSAHRRDYLKICTDSQTDVKIEHVTPKALLQLANLDEFEAKANFSRACARDLRQYKQALASREPWALKMLDASSKVPSGILYGNIVDLGVYDTCMEVNGRHCMYTLRPPLGELADQLPMFPKLSICVPASCTAADVFNLVNDTIVESDKLNSLDVTITTATCASIDTVFWDTEVKILLSVVGVYLGFLTFCTWCDYKNRKLRKEERGTLSRFSFIRSTSYVLNMKTRPGDLPAIHGVRVLSMAVIVLVHEYFVHLFAAYTNTFYLPKWYSSISSLILFIGLYGVDTFLAMSGFLMTYTFFKKIEKQKTFNIFVYYTHRFIRFSLPVMFIVAVGVILGPKITAGPLIETITGYFVLGCRSKWWSSLLYIQNFIDVKNHCLLHLWSLSVDMQLFWISPLILYPLHKEPKIGLAILGSLFLASIITSAWIVGMNKYSAIYFTHDFNISNMLESFNDVYTMPYTRASPWLLGILFGYEVTYKHVKPNKVVLRLGWILASAAFAFCIFGVRSFTRVDYEYSRVWEMLFAALGRPAWAFAICWIIYASLHRAAGPIGALLSWKIFLPLSRLSYSIYIMHITFPMLYIGTSRAPRYFNEYSILHSYVSNMGIAAVTAFFFSLIFEVPVLALEDLIFRRRATSLADTRKTE